MSKHTPGPWEREPGGYDGLPTIVSTAVDEQECICNLYQRGSSPYEQDDVTDANARLIAAAPDLLDVLQWWDEQMGDDKCDDMGVLLRNMTMKVHAAISKATGE